MLIIHHQEPTPRIRETKKTRIDMIEDCSKTTKESFLKRVLLCTISISIFAIIVCRSSWHANSLFPHSFNIYFFTALFSAFARTFERKFVFLVCNGILAILAKSSSNRTSSTSSPSRVPEFDVLASVSVEGEATVEGNVVSQNSASLAYVEDGLEQQEEKETDLLRIWSSRAGMKEDDEDINMEDGEEGGGGGGESVSNLHTSEETSAAISEDVSMEELNKTIEEFIRKMKEEIWIVAQNQLIAV